MARRLIFFVLRCWLRCERVAKSGGEERRRRFYRVKMKQWVAPAAYLVASVFVTVVAAVGVAKRGSPESVPNLYAGLLVFGVLGTLLSIPPIEKAWRKQRRRKEEDARGTDQNVQLRPPPWSRSAGSVCQELGVRPALGLSASEARDRLREHGANRIEVLAMPSYLRFFVKEIYEPTQLLLLCVGALYVMFGSLEEGATAFTVIFLLVVAEVGTEWRAKRALAALKLSTPRDAVVKRDGQLQTIPAFCVVPGDVVQLSVGMEVPADVRVLQAQFLEVDESKMTGESVPVPKDPFALHPEDAPLFELTNIATAGSLVTKGKGMGVVYQTGLATTLGQILARSQKRKDKKTKLQLGLKEAAWVLSMAALVASVVGALLGFLKHQRWQDILLSGLSLAFASIPEELPILIAAVLAVGSQTLSRRNVYVKFLRAAENLGFVDTVLTDKTGTLTKNKLILHSMHFGDCLVPANEITSRIEDSGFEALLKAWVFMSEIGDIAKESDIAVVHALVDEPDLGVSQEVVDEVHLDVTPLTGVVELGRLEYSPLETPQSITAWKQSGFCSRHSGLGQVPALPSSLIQAAALVLEALLRRWVCTLKVAQEVAENRTKKWDDQSVHEKVACQLSVVCIEMLLEFCSFGEPMLAFTAEIVGNRSLGLLDTLMSTECFLPKRCVNSLHELLYKLLGDTNFKHTFAQTFISHYPRFLREAIEEDTARAGTSMRSRYREHAIVNSFSVQIFTVPTLTPKLVMESSLLGMLLDTLKEFFWACVGEDGRISVSKGPVRKRHYFRIIEDIRYVMTHLEVSQYVAQKRPELARAWLHLLAFIQGMYPHRRMTSVHVEEETEDWSSAYSLEFQMAFIHPLFVAGAAASGNSDARFKDDLMSDPQSCFQAALDNLNGGSSSSKIVNVADSLLDPNSGTGGTGIGLVDVDMSDAVLAADSTCRVSTELNLQHRGKKENSMVLIAGMQVPAALVWLIDECAQVLDQWLAIDASRESMKAGQLANDTSSVQGYRRSHRWRGRGGRGVRDSPTQTTGGQIREWLRRSRRVPLEPRGWPEAPQEQSILGTNAGSDAADMDVEMQVPREGWDIRAPEWWMGPEASASPTILGQLGEENEWPAVEFDVSRQDVSFHIPLHRMLALLLHKALGFHSAKLEKSSGKDNVVSSVWEGSFLEKILPERFRVPGFAAVVMEHPLRLQVLCAQVQAGMWRRNGHTTSALCDLYHTVHWCESSLELDLFLLQCCSVISPYENFVERILARFSLSDYFNLSLWHPNEYQVTLAQELLILLIRLVSERGFCGLTEKEALRRELVQRLAVGDATHSYLLKALPPRLQDSKHLQECLDAVATYCNPSGMQQGKYVLREECWRELDLYHPRWSPRELQSAEERYLRACRAPAVFLQLPRWSEPFAALQDLGRLITTSRIHDMLRSIFFHAAFTEDPPTMELLLHALHLLSLALDVCKSANKSGGGRRVDLHSSASPFLDLYSPLHGSNNSSSSNVEDHPPLLLRCVERVAVGRVDATTMPEPQSMLSLLVLLLRKRVSDGVGEAGSYGFGDLIKKLLRSFAELDRGCMHEIELLAPEILHRFSVGTTLKAGGIGDINFKDDISVSESDRRRAIARERQAAAMAKMKAAQDRFVVNYKPGEGDEAEAKRPKESGAASDELYEDAQVTSCALCRDAASTSPLCFLVLIQRSKLLAVAEKHTPSWERSLLTLAEHVDREGETSEGASTATGSDGTRYLNSTAELWQWIQEALGDTQTRTRLLDGEDLLELLRNEPGIRNPPRVTREFPWNWDATAADTESEEVESSSEIIETENNSEAGTSEAAGTVDVNWWEDNYSRADQEESTTNRDMAVATVLAEYVATAVCRGESRSQERTRHGRNESPRQAGQAGPEQGREAATRTRRASARISLAMAESTRSKGNDTVGIHMSACGHAMHQECRDRYFSSLLQRFYNRALFEGVQIVDLEMGEFLCPVCRRLANAILPVLPGQTGLNSTFKSPSVTQLTSGVSSSPALLQVDHALRLLVKAEELVSRSEFRKVADPQLPDTVKVVLEDLSKRLCGLFYAEKDLLTSPSSAQGHVHQGLLLWDVFRYSLMSAELAARSQKVSVNTDNGLMALLEMGEASHGSVLPLLLHAAKATQSQSRQSVLLRARGMQLLLDSIVNGISRDMHANGIPRDKTIALLQYLEKDNDSMDVQLWKRLADPVLVHDAFSSFTWLLFCLPLPFPANGAPFTALVHLFYLVSIIQVIAQLGSFAASDAELTPSARSFIAAVHTGLSGTVLESSSVDSNVSLTSGPSLRLIRRNTLPFLRRCYLLQNLMSGAAQVLPVARAHQWELPQGYRQSTGDELASVDLKDGENQVQLEMEQLHQLESVFLIPPLEKIFEQDAIQHLVEAWCKHVKKDSSPRGIQYSPRVTTASPFKLMQLPYLFQDLMQRYVKERCPSCKTIPDKPALCLLCGALCCAASSRPCCSVNRQGECTRHSMKCGAGIGIFLMLRRTNILLQRCGRQAMWPSPYLDAFGEEDLELRRGKPLFLSRERYAALTNMVAAHGLDYSSPVLSHTTRDILF